MMIPIQDSHTIQGFIEKLTPDTKPLFGKMNAQQMIEHLIMAIDMSLGKYGEKLVVEPTKAAAIKRLIIYSDRKLPLGFQVPVLPEHPLPCTHADLAEACNELKLALSRFEAYYHMYPNQSHTHPTMGPLNYSEWTIMHGKHFAHHFEQFGLYTK